MFDDFERDQFPTLACTIQNAREEGVMDSAETYLCVIVDVQWPNQARLEYLRPYTARDGEELLFGWSGIGSDYYVDHCTKPVHEDCTRVVAWKRVEAPASFMPSPGWSK